MLVSIRLLRVSKRGEQLRSGRLSWKLLIRGKAPKRVPLRHLTPRSAPWSNRWVPSLIRLMHNGHSSYASSETPISRFDPFDHLCSFDGEDVIFVDYQDFH